MSRGTHDVFVIVVNFISNDWEAKHVTIGLFKMIDTIGATLAPKLWELMDKFFLTQNIMAYVKNEKSKLQMPWFLLYHGVFKPY